MTKYLVLLKDYNEGTGQLPDNYTVVGRYEADGTRAAIKAAALDSGRVYVESEQATYVAVPERNWRPETISVTPQPTLSFVAPREMSGHEAAAEARR